MKKIITIIICVFVGAVFARFLMSAFVQWQTGKAMKMGRIPSVTVGEVHEESIIKSFDAPGRVMSKSRIQITARVSGYLTKSFFKEGDKVKKGQVLFEIEPKEWQLATNKAKADLINSRAQLDYYSKQLVRYKELVKQDYVSKAQYDQILAQRDSYKAQVELNESVYQDALRNLGYTKVKAPVDGHIGMILVSVGNYVSPSSNALATVNSTDPMYVTFPIDAKDFTELVRIDKTAYVNRNVDLFFSDGTKYEYKGEGNFHDNSVDQATGTITMRATFPNPKGELIHNNYTTVRIYSKEKANVPVVPQTAVLENPQGKYVYKLDEKDLPQVQTIQVNGMSGKNWVIKSGLNKGDRIILTGLQSVIPGNPVKILTQEEVSEADKAAEKEAAAKEEKERKEGTN